MDVARARFWAGLGSARRNDLARLPGWEARLSAALDAAASPGGRAWIARDDFAAELAARLNDDDEADVARWWDHLRAGDLYLASACVRGVDGALDRFERPGLQADDLIQLLRAKLFTMPGDGGAAPGARPRIATYTGQGFLQNWIRVTATRTFIDCGRTHDDPPEVPMRNELVAVLPEPKGDPELQLLKREHMTHFKASFAEAVAALDSADRLLLKQHLVERLTIDQLGALYHLHRASAARRIAKARDALLVATRIALARRLGVPPERVASVLELVASRLEASIERLLA